MTIPFETVFVCTGSGVSVSIKFFFNPKKRTLRRTARIAPVIIICVDFCIVTSEDEQYRARLHKVIKHNLLFER